MSLSTIANIVGIAIMVEVGAMFVVFINILFIGIIKDILRDGI